MKFLNRTLLNYNMHISFETCNNLWNATNFLVECDYIYANLKIRNFDAIDCAIIMKKERFETIIIAVENEKMWEERKREPGYLAAVKMRGNVRAAA